MRRLPLFFVVLVLLAASFALPAAADVGKGFSMQLGSTFTVKGRTGSDTGKRVRALGKVVLSGRWGAGSWHVLATTTTDSAGNYRFTITPRRRGDLSLRIAPPDHHLRRYLLHVR